MSTTVPAGELPAGELLRELAPRVLATLVRRYGQFDACEDAVQEALLAAATQWPERGTPDSPHGWLVTVAARRLIDELRAENARRRREAGVHTRVPADHLLAPGADTEAMRGENSGDDTLTLLFLCCHPGLSVSAQLALTLRAVGGLSTAQIARAFLLPESTVGQRISRAKQRIRTSGADFSPPPEGEQASRLAVVLRVLYLIFTEGYTATDGELLHRAELTGEAIRLTREVHRLLPADGEVAGLLALMLLTDSRSPARTGRDGTLIPLAEQDRCRWKRASIEEGIALVTGALSTSVPGPYQVQAAIAAVHAESAGDEDTDWPQIAALYTVLERIAPGPAVTLNRAVALSKVEGPTAGLELLRELDGDPLLAKSHRPHAVRGHLLEEAGEPDEARASYLEAARRTASLPERRYLEARARRLGG